MDYFDFWFTKNTELSDLELLQNKEKDRSAYQQKFIGDRRSDEKKLVKDLIIFEIKLGVNYRLNNKYLKDSCYPVYIYISASKFPKLIHSDLVSDYLEIIAQEVINELYPSNPRVSIVFADSKLSIEIRMS